MESTNRNLCPTRLFLLATPAIQTNCNQHADDSIPQYIHSYLSGKS